jgi:hypothetical protein
VTSIQFLSQGEYLGDEARLEDVFPLPCIKEWIIEERREKRGGMDELKRMGNHGNEPQDDAGASTGRALVKLDEPSTTVLAGGLIKAGDRARGRPLDRELHSHCRVPIVELGGAFGFSWAQGRRKVEVVRRSHRASCQRAHPPIVVRADRVINGGIDVIRQALRASASLVGVLRRKKTEEGLLIKWGDSSVKKERGRGRNTVRHVRWEGPLPLIL